MEQSPQVLIRVLIVDDDQEIRDYLALALSGDTVAVVAVDGPDSIPSGEFAVALVDVMLADGASAVPAVHALRARGIPVVAMTGLSETAVAVQSMRTAGVAEVLGKPFSLRELRAVIGRYAPKSAPKSG